MGVNGYQGQIRACDQADYCFKANQEIMTLIKNDVSVTASSLSKIAIWAPPTTRFKLNGTQVQMGKTYVYELDNVEITSIQFVKDSPRQVIIDYLIQEV